MCIRTVTLDGSSTILGATWVPPPPPPPLAPSTPGNARRKRKKQMLLVIQVSSSSGGVCVRAFGGVVASRKRKGRDLSVSPLSCCCCCFSVRTLELRSDSITSLFIRQQQQQYTVCTWREGREFCQIHMSRSLLSRMMMTTTTAPGDCRDAI